MSWSQEFRGGTQSKFLSRKLCVRKLHFMGQHWPNFRVARNVWIIGSLSQHFNSQKPWNQSLLDNHWIYFIIVWNIWWCQKQAVRKSPDTINKNVIKHCMRKNKWGFKLKMTRLRMSGWHWLENLSNRWEFPGQMYWPIRGQYSGHVICPDQSEASISQWMRKFQNPVKSRWSRLWRSPNKSKYHSEQVLARHNWEEGLALELVKQESYCCWCP